MASYAAVLCPPLYQRSTAVDVAAFDRGWTGCSSHDADETVRSRYSLIVDATTEAQYSCV